MFSSDRVSNSVKLIAVPEPNRRFFFSILHALSPRITKHSTVL